MQTNSICYFWRDKAVFPVDVFSVQLGTNSSTPNCAKVLRHLWLPSCCVTCFPTKWRPENGLICLQDGSSRILTLDLENSIAPKINFLQYAMPTNSMHDLLSMANQHQNCMARSKTKMQQRTTDHKILSPTFHIISEYHIAQYNTICVIVCI